MSSLVRIIITNNNILDIVKLLSTIIWTLCFTTLDILPRDSASYCTDSSSAIFTATLFTVARKGKQPKSPSSEEKIMKCGACIYCRVCLSVKEFIKLSG